MTSWLDGLLQPIMVVVAWIMVQTHNFLTWLGFNPDGGWAWVLSIVALVVVMRVAMIPLFVKQIKASRGMQMVQPEIQKIQAKYKGKTDPASRQKMSQETMELYRKHGTNPFSSCLPILLQSPFFFALFRVLYLMGAVANGTQGNIGPLDQTVAQSAEAATLFGAPLSSTFMTASGADATNIRIVSLCLIVAMTATTFITQRQLTFKNMPEAAKNNPMASQQKMIMYIMPLIYAFSGVTFPLGVLIYWLTTNLWSMGQQFYVIRKNPAPGSDAEKAMLARKAKHGKVAVAEDEPDSHVIEGTVTKVGGQRVQPKRKSRQRAGQQTPMNAEPVQKPLASSSASTKSDAEPTTTAQRVPKKPQGPASERLAARRAAARQAAAERAGQGSVKSAKAKSAEPEDEDEDFEEFDDELEDEAEEMAAEEEPSNGTTKSSGGGKSSGKSAAKPVRSASWERAAARAAARKSAAKSDGNDRGGQGNKK